MAFWDRTAPRRRYRRERSLESLESRQLLAGDAVISEFMAINSSTLADEDGEFSDWIEIRNTNSQPLSLEGWYLTDSADSLTQWRLPKVTLAAEEHLVVFASGKNRTNPAGNLHTNFRLDGNGEFLAIVRPDGKSISDAFAPEFPQQVSDVSYGRSSDLQEVGFFPVPTPGSANAVNPVLDPLRTVVINEIMYHPPTENDAEEFIELFNRGTTSVDLSGWRITGGVDFTFPQITLPAGQYLVVAADEAAFRAAYGDAPIVVGPWTGRLSNSSNSINLRNSSGQRLDSLTYADEGEWAERMRGPDDRGHFGWVWSDAHDGGGRTLELTNPSLPNEVGANWRSSVSTLGTPGRANSVMSSNIAPLIVDTEHLPIIPHSDQAVTVTARIIDEQSTGQTVRLHWRVDGQAEFQQVVMHDDGLAGDRFAGDGLFLGQLPAHPDLTVIEYFVAASDAAGNTRTWPAPTADAGQATNALYQVLDAFDPEAFTEPGLPPVYYEIMTAVERNEFTNINRSSDAQMNATFIAHTSDGLDIRHNAGVRIRGSGSRSRTPPNNRINLPSDQSWQGGTALNINVLTPWEQIAGSVFFRLAGLPAANAKGVRMFSNGVNLTGNELYVHVEPLNGDSAENHFPDDRNGNIYKGARSNVSPPGGLGAGLYYRGEDPIPYSSYHKLTNESEADWSDVINLTYQLRDRTTPEEQASYLNDVAAVADIDQWLRFFALNALLGNTEGGLVNGDQQGDDYAMYRGIEDPRFIMIPHDLDSLFSGVTGGFLNATNIPAINQLISHPEIRPRYFAQFKDLIENVVLTDQARSHVADALRHVTTERQVNDIFNYLQARADFLSSRLSDELDFQSQLPRQDELHTSRDPFAELHGSAPADANSVRINGQAVRVNNNLEWQLGSFNATVVRWDADWAYLDNGSDQGTAWREVEYVQDANWKSGPAQLGYGDGDERTVVGFGDDVNNRHITTYFRHEFNIDDVTKHLSLAATFVLDDGMVLYLNGTEIHRANLPNGEPITFQTRATNNINGAAERSGTTINIDHRLLRPGKNVLAAEVHQFAPDSDDISFGLTAFGRFRPGNSGIPLQPGVNRITVEAMSGVDGTGDVVDTKWVDILYAPSTPKPVSGELPAGETVWLAKDGPYQLSGVVTVPADGTLRIEPGTSVYFEQDAELVVKGKLIAVGNEFGRIRFTSVPGAPHVPNRPGGRDGLPDAAPKWDGIHFVDSHFAENRIAFADIQDAQDSDGSIGAQNSTLQVDHITVSGTHLRMIYGVSSSLVVRDSQFPDMFGPDENPATLGLDNVSEHIKIIGTTPEGGQLLIQGNHFGTNKGHNDVIDADSNRFGLGPILQVRDNVFDGAGDELLDLGGDVLVVGNLFRNVFKDDTTSDRGYANAISTGDTFANSTIVVARNVFYNVDHAINLKNGAASIFENNTVVKVHPDFNDRFGNPNVGSAINLYVDEPGGTPATGAYAGRNIFVDVPRVFGNADLPGNRRSELQLFDNLLTPELSMTTVGQRAGSILGLGSGNRIGDARLSDPDQGNFSLLPGSLALGPGPADHLGAGVPDAVRITGEPTSTTDVRRATLTVSGPGMIMYRYRVNGGAWSADLPIGNRFESGRTVRSADIQLANLTPGIYTVEVVGMDFAGVWQTEPTRSQSWTVVPAESRVLINEVLASSQRNLLDGGPLPDQIELHNPGSLPINLRGYSLTDNGNEPERFVFANDTILPAGGYLTLSADDDSSPGVHLGFSLRREGETVMLFAPASPGVARELVDHVEFGIQIPDFSIGRVGQQREWALTKPTFGSANQPALTGRTDQLVINEWLTNHPSIDDFVELFNRDTLPVPLGGLYLSDAADATPDLHPIAPLSFIAGNDFLVLHADGETNRGADHLPFRLSIDQETIGLSDVALHPIDTVVYGPQTPSYSQGRIPTSIDAFEFFALPTPGWANGSGFLGDFNLDGQVTVTDVDLMCSAVRSLDADPQFDLDRNGQVDFDDMQFLIGQVLDTTFGDANLDGIFSSSDLILVFIAGEYEDNIPGNSTWAEGDWNCDGEFTSSDLIVSFRAGGYTVAAQPAAVAAPPHSTSAVLALSIAPQPSITDDTVLDDSSRQADTVSPKPHRPRLDSLSRDALFDVDPREATDWNSDLELAVLGLSEEDLDVL